MYVELAPLSPRVRSKRGSLQLLASLRKIEVYRKKRPRQHRAQLVGGRTHSARKSLLAVPILSEPQASAEVAKVLLPILSRSNRGRYAPLHRRPRSADRRR